MECEPAERPRRIHTTTPACLTPALTRLIETLAPGRDAVRLRVQADPQAVVNECFVNVETRVAASGGNILCGWQLWEWPDVLVEAEFHAVWCSPGGTLIDLTPKQQGETDVLFVPDPELQYTGQSRDNVRQPLRDDWVIHHYIRVSELIVELVAGSSTPHTREVSLPANQIMPLLEAQAFLGESLVAGLRNESPCLCGSGQRFKRCHGPVVSQLTRASRTLVHRPR